MYLNIHNFIFKIGILQKTDLGYNFGQERKRGLQGSKFRGSLDSSIAFYQNKEISVHFIDQGDIVTISEK